MENDKMESGTPSYWSAVLTGALVIALITAVLGIASQYMIIGSEPVGSAFTLGQGVGSFACLFALIGGIIATRQYAKEYQITFTIGKGALIGLLTGVIGALISSVITLLWNYVIDPELTQAVYDWSIANLEAQNMTQDQLEATMAFIPKPGGLSSILWQSLIGVVTFGIMNAISGLVGAKIFASEED